MRQPRWVAAIALLVGLVWLASEVSAQIPVIGGDKFQGLKWTFVRIKYGTYEGEGNGRRTRSWPTGTSPGRSTRRRPNRTCRAASSR